MNNIIENVSSSVSKSQKSGKNHSAVVWMKGKRDESFRNRTTVWMLPYLGL